MKLYKLYEQVLGEADYSYHYGDIENVDDIKPYRSDSLVMMRGRQTGHFGSGMYFSTYNYCNAMNNKKYMDKKQKSALTKVNDNVYRVDMDMYKNLYRVKSENEGNILYYTLNIVNNFNEEFTNLVDGGKNVSEAFNRLYRSKLKIENNFKYLNLTLPADDEFLKLLIKNAKLMSQNKTGPSLSTQIMEFNGYNGVNVQNISGYDNRLHGSVIYDMSKIDVQPKKVTPNQINMFCKIDMKTRVVTTDFNNDLIGKFLSNSNINDNDWFEFKELPYKKQKAIIDGYYKLIPVNRLEKYLGDSKELLDLYIRNIFSESYVRYIDLNKLLDYASKLFKKGLLPYDLIFNTRDYINDGEGSTLINAFMDEYIVGVDKVKLLIDLIIKYNPKLSDYELDGLRGLKDENYGPFKDDPITIKKIDKIISKQE